MFNLNQSRHIRIYDLHSWTGVSVGLYLYLVCITGCFALFSHEIQTWENDAKRLELPAEPVQVHSVFSDWAQNTIPENAKSVNLFLGYPDIHEPYYSGFLFAVDGDGEQVRKHTYWNASTGQELVERGGGLSEWILDFHRDLMWPDSLGGRQIGRFLVGLAGIVLLLSIVTGVVIHSKISKEMFKLRVNRSMRLKWTDYHKILGVWGLPFHTMIAITGAFLGVITLILPALAMLVFKGDQATMIDKLGFGEIEPAHQVAQMYSLDEVAKMTWQDGESRHPKYVIIRNWGDTKANYEVAFEADQELMMAESLSISGVTGEPMQESSVMERTFTNRVFMSISVLHYGTYGNVALKVLYFLLGIGLSIVSAFGIVIWVEKRRYSGKSNEKRHYYRWLTGLSIGVCVGLPLATAAIFHADKLMAVAEDSRLAVTGWVYFVAVVFSIVWAYLRDNEYRAIKELLCLTSLASITIPLTNYLTTGDLFLNKLIPADASYAWVDMAAFLLGVCLLAMASVLPAERPQAQHKRAVPTSEAVAT